jgi:hypothetical protein
MVLMVLMVLMNIQTFDINKDFSKINNEDFSIINLQTSKINRSHIDKIDSLISNYNF